MHNELNDDFQDLLRRVKYKDDSIKDPLGYNMALADKMDKAKPKDPTEKPKGKELTYEQIAFALKSQVKKAPIKPYDQLTDKEKAVHRKRQLQELHDKAAKDAEPEGAEAEPEGAAKGVTELH